MVYVTTGYLLQAAAHVAFQFTHKFCELHLLEYDTAGRGVSFSYRGWEEVFGGCQHVQQGCGQEVICSVHSDEPSKVQH